MKETPQEYTARVLGCLGGRSALTVQRATSGKLARLLRGLSRKHLRAKPAPGKWSIGEIMAHLAEVEMVTGYRYRMMLFASGGPIQAFDQDKWAEGRYNRMDAQKSLLVFRALREFNLALLKSLTAEQWQCYGMHSERGKESVAHYARMIAGHDLNHLAQIERMRQQFRKRRRG